jgi:phosphoribosylformylglycinamidine synthase subunit PurS
VRVGRFIEMAIEARSREEARERVDAMCRKLLANTVIEDYRHPFHNPGRTTAWS